MIHIIPRFTNYGNTPSIRLDILKQIPVRFILVIPLHESPYGIDSLNGKRIRERRMLQEKRSHIQYHGTIIRRVSLYFKSRVHSRHKRFLQGSLYIFIPTTVNNRNALPQTSLYILPLSREHEYLRCSGKLPYNTFPVITRVLYRRSEQHILTQQIQGKLHVHIPPRVMNRHYSFCRFYIFTVKELLVSRIFIFPRILLLLYHPVSYKRT